jgi:hypothetical protein
MTAHREFNSLLTALMQGLALNSSRSLADDFEPLCSEKSVDDVRRLQHARNIAVTAWDPSESSFFDCRGGHEKRRPDLKKRVNTLYHLLLSLG